MKRKVAIYTRVSTKEQLKQGYSIQQQADLLIKKAKQIFPDAEGLCKHNPSASSNLQIPFLSR